MRHFFLNAISLTFLVFASMSCTKQVPVKPNILFIFPDQYRNYSLGFWSEPGNEEFIQGKPDPVSTPALDKLAQEGVVFSRAVSNFPLCSPYRGMLLSGMYPNQNGISNNCRVDRSDHLNPNAECVTDVFSEAGYDVAYFGKCHWLRNDSVFTIDGTYVGSQEAPGGYAINRYDTYVPPGQDRHSIDYFFQVLKDDHFNPLVYSNDPKAIDGKKDGELFMPGRFSAELESEIIIDYLSNTHGQRDPEKPFFLIWSLNPPHNPWTEESTYMEFYDQYTDSGNVDLNKLLTHDNVDKVVGEYAPYYFANVSAVDYFIGKVLDQLKEQGLDENTIIVFSSDHGEMLGSHGQRGKNVPEIESFNIPFILKWKNKIQHRVDDLILGVPDVMPTLLGLAGLENIIPASVQGVNYASKLLDPESQQVEKPKSALFLNSHSRGIYTGKYMLVIAEKGGKLNEAYCYDNEVDPYQLNKLPLEELDEADALLNELSNLLKSTNDKWYEDRICSEILNY